MGADEAEPADTMMCCASCGTSECDDIKLKTCTACKLVRYCSVECQKKHRSQHKKACKKKVAEIRDELLFKQPESSHLGDCPICLLPFPIDEKMSRSAVMACCIKTICNGCAYANALRQDKESLGHKCPFCRHPAPKSKEEAEVIAMRRIEAKDPVAMAQMGTKRLMEGDFSGAYEYWAKAAELGDAGAHYHLAVMHDEGQFVEKDMKKAMYHWEEAAIAGHPGARHNLGCYEGINGRIDRAMKHFIIATNLGYDQSVKMLKQCYADGNISKEDFAAALRVYQAAVDATKSPQREAAERNPDFQRAVSRTNN